jgi:hypothetical protein
LSTQTLQLCFHPLPPSFAGQLLQVTDPATGALLTLETAEGCLVYNYNQHMLLFLSLPCLPYTGQLLQVIDPATGSPLTLDQLKAELVIAALAGFETTSMALSWTLGALACHPDVMKQLEQVCARYNML